MRSTILALQELLPDNPAEAHMELGLTLSTASVTACLIVMQDAGEMARETGDLIELHELEAFARRQLLPATEDLLAQFG